MHADHISDQWLEQRIACHQCDLLLKRPEVKAGQRASCPRCRHLISSRPVDGLRKALAFAYAALVFVWIANTYPFLAFESTGLANTMSLPAASFELYREGRPLLAAFVLGFIIVIPGLITVLLIVLLTAAIGRRIGSWMIMTTRLLYTLSPWSMAEVFIISAIVSLVKISDMAEVELHLAFWAYILFTVCFSAALANTDRYHLWRLIGDRTVGR